MLVPMFDQRELNSSHLQLLLKEQPLDRDMNTTMSAVMGALDQKWRSGKSMMVHRWEYSTRFSDCNTRWSFWLSFTVSSTARNAVSLSFWWFLFIVLSTIHVIACLVILLSKNYGPKTMTQFPEKREPGWDCYFGCCGLSTFNLRYKPVVRNAVVVGGDIEKNGRVSADEPAVVGVC